LARTRPLYGEARRLDIAGNRHRNGATRNARELITDAVQRYLSQRRWFRKDEVRARIVQGLESLRQGKGLDGGTVMAELLAELDAPENVL
jgi:hypothetical protein